MATFHSVCLPDDLKRKEIERINGIGGEMHAYFAENKLWLGSELEENVGYAIGLMHRALDRHYGPGHLDRIDTSLKGEMSDGALHDEIRGQRKRLQEQFRSLLTIDSLGDGSKIRFSRGAN